ncbi:MAG: TRAP transporter small permease [Syntrophomonadaceae bacterium]|nr:TRAP transporter small permease [Syntrophomonadaceae bacterium]
MTRFEQVVHSIARSSDRIAQITTFVMMLTIVANCSGRIIRHPVYGTEDYVSLLSLILVSTTIAYCAVQKAHIRIDLVFSRFSQTTQAIVGSIIDLLGLGLFTTVSWQCVALGMRMMKTGDKTMSALITLYPFLFVVAFGCALFSLVLLVDLAKWLAKAVEK